MTTKIVCLKNVVSIADRSKEMSFLRRVASHFLRDRVRSSAIREGLGVEPLLPPGTMSWALPGGAGGGIWGEGSLGVSTEFAAPVTQSGIKWKTTSASTSFQRDVVFLFLSVCVKPLSKITESNIQWPYPSFTNLHEVKRFSEHTIKSLYARSPTRSA
ncbi:hypothetical protein AMECASPLE_039617 [Ameca splendens]|uniref:Uncharacterized protein n=1 Tax=Ameca splendens TaxID=208324 RepID=A0ABV0YJV7_9TELE